MGCLVSCLHDGDKYATLNPAAETEPSAAYALHTDGPLSAKQHADDTPHRPPTDENIPPQQQHQTPTFFSPKEILSPPSYEFVSPGLRPSEGFQSPGLGFGL